MEKTIAKSYVHVLFNDDKNSAGIFHKDNYNRFDRFEVETSPVGIMVSVVTIDGYEIDKEEVYREFYPMSIVKTVRMK